MSKRFIHANFLMLLLGLFASSSGYGADLVLHYTFDEGAGRNVSDLAGPYHAQMEGSGWEWNPDGVLGGAVSFGNNGRVVSDPQVWSDLSGNEVTVTVWLNMDPTASTPWVGHIFFAGDSFPPMLAGRFWANSMTFWPNWGAWGIADTQADMAGNWHHYAFVKDGATKAIFFDGEQVFTHSDSKPIESVSAFSLGAGVGAGNEPLEGSMDDFRIYNGALNQDEILRTMVADFPQASSPTPADGATNVPREGSELSWEPGDFAVMHDVYFGEDSDVVNNAVAGDPAHLATQLGTSYALDRLKLETTYYWRIDEVNTTNPGSPWKGSVWSFTTEPVALPIAGELITTTASSADAGNDPSTASNGAGLDADGLHDIFKADMWLSAGDDPEPSIRFDLDRVYKLHEMLVWNYNSDIEPVVGQGIKEAKIEYMDADGTWNELSANTTFNQAPGDADYAANTLVPLNGVAAQAIGITALSSWTQLPEFFPQKGLSEVQLSYIPVWAADPQPASDAAGAEPDLTLSWRAGCGAAQHVVSIGTDPDALAPADPVNETSFDTTDLDLELDRTYYWQVAEVNEAETPSAWDGPVWSFTTADVVVVDSFDQYTDDDAAGEAIWQSWIDGFDVPGNGAQAGYLVPPYAERAIVHGGSQSMPLLYDNTAGSSLSEAIRTFDEARNFAGHGVQGLVLYFHGDATNTGGQFYVKINDSTVLFDGDASALTRTGWSKWYIVLADVVGADLTQVKSLTVGVDNGGKGVVYVDDIVLTPEARSLVTPVEPGPENLVGYYPLDEGTGRNVSDASGNNHNGTFVGNPRWVAGKIGGAIEIPGEGSSAELGTWNPSAKTGQISVWLWLKWGGLDGRWQGMVSKKNTGTDMMWQFHTDLSTGRIRVWQQNAPWVWTPDSPVEGQWEHWGFSFDGNTLIIYRNGEPQIVNDEFSFGTGTGTPVIIGAISPGGFEAFRGVLDDIRLYDRVLTLAEIAWLVGRTEPFDL